MKTRNKYNNESIETQDNQLNSILVITHAEFIWYFTSEKHTDGDMYNGNTQAVIACG